MPSQWAHCRVWAEAAASLGWIVAAGCHGAVGLGRDYTAALLLFLHSLEGRLAGTDGTEAVR